MEFFNKIKKSKVVRYLALAGAGIGIMHSAPAYSQDINNYNSAGQKVIEAKITDDYQLPEYIKANVNIEKKGLESRLECSEDPVTGHSGIESTKPKCFITSEEITSALLPERMDYGLKKTFSLMELPINIIIGYGSTVLLHESGHMATGRILGYRDISLSGPDLNNRSVMVTHIRKLEGYNDNKKLFISSGGIMATTLGNITLESMLYSGSIPPKLRPLAATTALFMLFDRHRYILQSAVFNFAGMISKTDDIHKILDAAGLESDRDKRWMYAASLVSSTLELFLRKDNISSLLRTALGKEAKFKSDNTIGLGTYLTDHNIMVGMRGKW